MGCYRCGSDEGDESRLCPKCREGREEERQSARVVLKERPEETDFIHGLSQSHWVKASLIIHAFTIFYVLLLFTGPLKSYGLIASFLFAVMTASAVVSIFIGVHFWIQMLLHDTMWGLMTVLFPGFIYRYAYINWELKSVKVFMAFQVGTTIISIAAALMLAAYINMNVIQIWYIFEGYLYRGRPAPDPVLLMMSAPE